MEGQNDLHPDRHSVRAGAGYLCVDASVLANALLRGPRAVTLHYRGDYNRR